MIQREKFPRVNQPRANPSHSPSSCTSPGKPGREAAKPLPKCLLLILFAFRMLQKNIQSLKRYYFIQTLQLLLPMLQWMKTEYFEWSGNTNQFQEISTRAGCLPPLSFSSLALHINPLQTLFEELCRSLDWTQTLKEKDVSGGVCYSLGDLCECEAINMWVGQLFGCSTWVELGNKRAVETSELQFFWEDGF